MRRVHVEYYEKNSKNNNKKRALRNWKHDKIKKKSRNFGRYSWKNFSEKNRTKRPKEGKLERNDEKRGAQSRDPTSR